MNDFYKNDLNKKNGIINGEDNKNKKKTKNSKNKKTIVTENNIDLNFDMNNGGNKVLNEEESEDSSSSSDFSLSSIISLKKIGEDTKDENDEKEKKEKENKKETKLIEKEKENKKELNLLKLILKFKNNNTLYNEKRSVEEKNGIIGKDDIANISLIINENSKVKPQINEELVELNLLKDSFSSKENQISLKMKSAMSKVINKYIRERRRHQSNQKIINYQGIKELNEKNILQLNYSIKNINNNINHIKFLAGKRK